MNVHPLAELIPGMTDGEFEDLKADIEENGQQEPITLFEGQLLDGRHRYRACRELGIQPSCREYEGDKPAAFVLSLNVNRRNLTPGQKAAIAVEFLPELAKEAKKGQAEALDSRRGPDGRARVAPRTHSGRKPDPHRARNDAGALVGVSGATVDRARRVKELDPERFEEVKAGNLAVRTADEQVRTEKRSGERVVTTTEFEVHTERQRQIAEKNKTRMEKAVGRCAGINSGFPHLKVSEATALATDEEIHGWIGVFEEAIRSIRQLKRQLEDIR